MNWTTAHEPPTSVATGAASTAVAGHGPSQRRAYETPRLTVWGDIEDLTEGSTGTSSDGGSTSHHVG